MTRTEVVDRAPALALVEVGRRLGVVESLEMVVEGGRGLLPEDVPLSQLRKWLNRDVGPGGS